MNITKLILIIVQAWSKTNYFFFISLHFNIANFEPMRINNNIDNQIK